MFVFGMESDAVKVSDMLVQCLLELVIFLVRKFFIETNFVNALKLTFGEILVPKFPIF